MGPPRNTVDGRNLAPPNKPWDDDSFVNTIKKLFPLNPWFQIGAGNMLGNDQPF